MNKIDSSLLLTNNQLQTRKTGSDVLGKDDFLKILMTQLQHQDPLNPMQDKDFIAQMATFSSLEQMTNMGKSIDKFVDLQQQNSMVTYNQFVGKNINWHKLSESEDGTQFPIVEQGNGRVSSIQFKDNQVYFILENGMKLEPSNVSQINEVQTEGHMLQASMMIGKTVTYHHDNSGEKVAAVKSVSFKDGKTVFELDDEARTKITSSQILKIE